MSSSREEQPSSKSAPAVTVVVPVYNDPVRLRDCLKALAAQTLDPARFEVVVVDNAPSSSLPTKIAEFPAAQILWEPRPGSYAARNVGYGAARGDFIAFTDADCQPCPRWLESGLSYFDSHPDTDAIGGRIELQTSEQTTAAELYERIFSFRQQRCIVEHGFAFTANLIVRRSALALVGPFDASLRSGGDRDWGQRLHLAGGRLDYVCQAAVRHPARSRLAELVHKRRRLQSGRSNVPTIVELIPGWDPPQKDPQPRGARMALELVVSPGTLGLARIEGVRVLGVAAILAAVGVLERLRLLAGGAPLR